MLSDVRVGIKLRPFTEKEINENLSLQWIVRGNSIVSLDRNTKRTDDEFHFDYIFDQDATNSKVFDSIVKPVVDAAINGFNGIVFCYGQRDSGKTYTMSGASEDLGLIPLSIKRILDTATAVDTEREFVLRMTCSEVHDEKLYDMLDEEEIEVKLSNSEVTVNSTKNNVNSLSDILSVIQTKTDDKRIREANRDNVSHTVFRIIIESRQVEGDTNRSVQTSELYFVDLAGFKEVPSANAFRENRTDAFLLALESLLLEEHKLESFQRCINNPNNKLMQLLQTPLGGNALIVMLCTVMPCALEESHHTLSLASRVKSLKIDPRRNVNSRCSTIQLFAPLPTELLTELKKIQNGSLVDIGDVESNNVRAIDKRVVLFERQIPVPGRKSVYQEPIVYKSRRENWLKDAGAFRQHLFQNETGLPTIIEMSPEKPFKKRNITQLVDVTNRTFHAAFTDFQLDLIATNNETNRGHDIRDKCITIHEYDMGLNKQDTAVQTSNNSLSPMPKSMLRKYISDRAKAFNELLEFADLECQLLAPREEKEKDNQYSVYPEELSTQPIICSNLKRNSLIRLERENVRLVEDLRLKNEELNEIKNDFRSLKSDLEKTICLLTNENAELLHKLSAERKRSTEAESNHRKTIGKLQTRILDITVARIKLENEQLNDDQTASLKVSAKSGDEQLSTQCQSEIGVLETEDIEPSKLQEKNKELEDIEESESESKHECIYKCKVLTFIERCECLAKENEKLSAELIAKNKENDTLKEQNKILNDKVSLLDTTNTDENDVEELRSVNSVLQNENMALKMKVMMLTDESTRLSDTLLDDPDNLHNGNLNNNKIHLTTDGATTLNASMNHVSMTESYQELASRVAELQNENEHLSRLNKDLSKDKELCYQCARFKKLDNSHKPIALEMKTLNRKLDYLQKKFNRECAHIDTLKNQELNFSFESSFNASFPDPMNLSFSEQRMLQLNNELENAKKLYGEICEDIKNFCDTKYVKDDCKDFKKSSKKQASEIETKLEGIQRIMNEAREEISDMKIDIAQFKSERADLLEKIATLEGVNEELREIRSQMEVSLDLATQKVKTFEDEKLNVSKELDELLAKEKAMRMERAKLDEELKHLRAEKEATSKHIVELNRTINEQNERATALTQEHQFSVERIESKYESDLDSLKRQCEELERVKAEAEERAMLRTKELESIVEELRGRISELENENAVLKNKCQENEICLNKSKDLECKNELKQFNEHTKESEIELNNLTREITEHSDKEDCICTREKTINVCNEIKELDTVKERMVNELRSLQYNVDTEDFLNKRSCEIFEIIMHTIMSIINEFEKDKQKLEDEKQQIIHNENCKALWVKALEEENENFRSDLAKKDSLCKEQQREVLELIRLLKEANNEKDALKLKVQELELDMGSLQSDFDKQCKVEVRQEGEIVVAHKRGKEIQEAFRQKEDELQSGIIAEKEMYEKKIDELISTIEKYKTMNMELRSNIKGLEANEEQLKNIIDANALDLKAHNQTIQKMNRDFEQLTEAYNELTAELEELKSKIADITKLLKNKCDTLSEYKSKLETIMPDYEMLQSQTKERREAIERYKEEIANLTMEKDKEIAAIKDKLNSEDTRNNALVEQLVELNNTNTALIEESNNLRHRNEELIATNAKLERKIRNGMNKLKAEATLEELKDANKSLQNNLDGASNRIHELQESKNTILKELVNLKDQYESLSQENAELKMLLHGLEQNSPRLSQENSKYDALVQEKNKIVLELEDNKLLLIQRDKEIRECMGQIKELTAKKSEFDNQLKKWNAIIHERDSEILMLKAKLNPHQVKNEWREKLNVFKTENKNLEQQVKAFETKSQVDREEMENTKFHNEYILCTLKKDCAELQKKLCYYEHMLESKNCSGSSRTTSPFEIKRRRTSRNEMFNEKRHLENVTIATDVDNEETCQILRRKIQQLEWDIVSKNGQIAALELQIQSENFAYEQKCKDLQEEMLALRKKNDQLRTEVRKLHRVLTDVNTRDCEKCRRWNLSKREQACQTMNDGLLIFNTDNEIIKKQINVTKLEKDYDVVKDVCRSQRSQLKDLETKVKDLENALKNRK